MFFQIPFQDRLPFRAYDFGRITNYRNGNGPMEINGLIGTAVDENRYPGVGF